MAKKGGISREDFEAFKFGVERLKELQRELNSLDTKKFKAEADSIRAKLKDVSQIPMIERDLRILKLKIQNKYHPVKKRRGTSGAIAVSGIHDDLKEIKEDLEENLPAIKSAIKKLGKKVENVQNQNLSFKITSVNLRRKVKKLRRRKHQKKKAKVNREKIVQEKIKKRKNRKNKARRKKIKMKKENRVSVPKKKIVKKIKPVKKIAPVKKKIRRHRKRVSKQVKKKIKKMNPKESKDAEIKNKIIRILTHEKALSLNEIKKRLKKMGVKKGKGAIKRYIKMIEKDGKIKEIKS